MKIKNIALASNWNKLKYKLNEPLYEYKKKNLKWEKHKINKQTKVIKSKYKNKC